MKLPGQPHKSCSTYWFGCWTDIHSEWTACLWGATANHKQQEDFGPRHQVHQSASVSTGSFLQRIITPERKRYFSSHIMTCRTFGRIVSNRLDHIVLKQELIFSLNQSRPLWISLKIEPWLQTYNVQSGTKTDSFGVCVTEVGGTLFCV